MSLDVLYGWVGRRVRTPRGEGVLLQIFRDRATVLQDGEDRVRFFPPRAVVPTSQGGDLTDDGRQGAEAQLPQAPLDGRARDAEGPGQR